MRETQTNGDEVYKPSEEQPLSLGPQLGEPNQKSVLNAKDLRHSPRSYQQDARLFPFQMPTRLADGFGLKELPYRYRSDSPQFPGSPVSLIGNSAAIFSWLLLAILSGIHLFVNRNPYHAASFT